jgi:hypothetical protein
VNPARAEAVLRQITQELENLFAQLQPIASGFERMATLQQPGREDLIDLRGAIADVISHPGLVSGAGVIVSPGILADAPYWMEWWWSTAKGDPEALRLNLEPSAPDFFDYTTAEWYAMPKQTGARHIAGPYVDYSCRNDYALTLAQPVQADGKFVGVAALDITATRLEQWLLPLLAPLVGPTALVNATGRVIMSTSATAWPGQRASEPAGEPVTDPSVFGWHIVGLAPDPTQRGTSHVS